MVHLAAVTSVLRSIEQPQLTFATNVIGTNAVLQAARAAGGDLVGLRLDQRRDRADDRAEDLRGGAANPLTPYGSTKPPARC